MIGRLVEVLPYAAGFTLAGLVLILLVVAAGTLHEGEDDD